MGLARKKYTYLHEKSGERARLPQNMAAYLGLGKPWATSKDLVHFPRIHKALRDKPPGTEFTYSVTKKGTVREATYRKVVVKNPSDGGSITIQYVRVGKPRTYEKVVLRKRHPDGRKSKVIRYVRVGRPITK